MMEFNVPCAVLTTINCALPETKIDVENWIIPYGVVLADPMFMSRRD